MVKLYDKLKYLYPNAIIDAFGPIILVDDGNGAYIAKWDNSLGEQPTQAQLDAVELPITKLQKKQEITNARFIEETSGISVSGTFIKTDRESQSTLAGAWVLLQQLPFTLIDWKGENGWVKLNKYMIEEISKAVGLHVQNCFTKEKELHTLIDNAKTIEEVLSIKW